MTCESEGLYIGETERPMDIRIPEHRTAIKRSETTKSGLAWKKHHNTVWTRADIIYKAEHWYKRKFKEVDYITAHKKILSEPIICKYSSSEFIGHLPSMMIADT